MITFDESRELLQGPADYFAADDLERFTICNGCGSAKAKFDFVPDSILGLKISPVCNIHDWRYAKGHTEEDRLKADREFLDNLLTLIEHHAEAEIAAHQGWQWMPYRAAQRTLRFARRYRAQSYYTAVRDLGAKAFWSGKERPHV